VYRVPQELSIVKRIGKMGNLFMDTAAKIYISGPGRWVARISCGTIVIGETPSIASMLTPVRAVLDFES